MTDNIIERAAIAITPGWATASRNTRRNAMLTVAAVLEAIRAPTHDMVERGTIATLRLQLGKGDNDAWDATRGCWDKMIDAALADMPV